MHVGGGGSAQPTCVAVRCRFFASSLEPFLIRFAGSSVRSGPICTRNRTVAKACGCRSKQRRAESGCCFPSPWRLPDVCLPPYTRACRRLFRVPLATFGVPQWRRAGHRVLLVLYRCQRCHQTTAGAGDKQETSGQRSSHEQEGRSPGRSSIEPPSFSPARPPDEQAAAAVATCWPQTDRQGSSSALPLLTAANAATTAGARGGWTMVIS